MSGDCYRVCPKCKRNYEAEKKRLGSELAQSYGKIPAAEFLKLKDKADAPMVCGDSLREDYEIYTDEHGEFHVSYWCSCSECEFEFSYSHKEQALKPDNS